MIGLQGRAESPAAKEAEAVALQKGERERERRQQHENAIYHKSDFPVNKVTLCKQLNFSQLSRH